MGSIPPPLNFQLIKDWFTAIPEDTSIEIVDGLDVCIGSTRGLKRANNEDRACFARIGTAGTNVGSVYVGLLCDGLGGMEAGAQCAVTAISVVLSELTDLMRRDDPKSALLQAIRIANEEIFKVYHGKGGTTLCAVLVTRNELFGVSVGDSRVYGVRSNGRVSQLTIDDTVAAEVGLAASISASKLEQLEFGEQLTQFLGIGPDLRLREIDANLLGNIERIVVLSDGAWRSSNGAFLKIIANATSASEMARRIINTSNWCGGVDNTTILVLPNLNQLSANKSTIFSKVNGIQADIWSSFGRLSVADAERLESTRHWPSQNTADELIHAVEIARRRLEAAVRQVQADPRREMSVRNAAEQARLQLEEAVRRAKSIQNVGANVRSVVELAQRELDDVVRRTNIALRDGKYNERGERQPEQAITNPEVEKRNSALGESISEATPRPEKNWQYETQKTRRRRSAVETNKQSGQKQTDLKLSKTQNEKAVKPKQLDIQIVVHDNASTSKKIKQQKVTERRGHGRDTFKKTKTSR